MSDASAISVALGLVNLVIALVGLCTFVWKGGGMAERLRRTEETTNKMHSQFPKALEKIARIEERIDPRPRALSCPGVDKET